MTDHETITEALVRLDEAGGLAEEVEINGEVISLELAEHWLGGDAGQALALHAILEGSWWKDCGVCLEPGLVAAGHKHKAVASGYPLGRAPTALLALCRAYLGEGV